MVAWGVELFDGCGDVGGDDVDEVGVVVEDADLVDFHSGKGGILECRGDIFAVLTAAGVAAEAGGDIAEHAADTVIVHLFESLWKERMPVAVAPIERQVDVVLIKFGAECGEEITALLVDRADTIEVVVVFGDFEESFAGDRFASEDIFQEGNHIFAFFRAAEGEDEDGVVGEVERHDGDRRIEGRVESGGRGSVDRERLVGSGDGEEKCFFWSRQRASANEICLTGVNMGQMQDATSRRSHGRE